MSDKKVLQTGGFDPNAGLVQPKELALVVRGQQDLQNKHLGPGMLGKVTDDLHRSALNIQEQFARMPAITTDDIYARAGALLQSVKGLLKQSDLERKAITNPILALKKAVDDVFTITADASLHNVKVAIEERMLAFAQKKREEQQAAQRAAALAAKAEADRLAAEARAAGNEGAAQMLTDMAAEAEAPKPAAVVESHGVKTQLRTRKHVQVTKLRVALAYIAAHATDLEISGIITVNSRALTSFATRKAGGELSPMSFDPLVSGLEVTETDSITNF